MAIRLHRLTSRLGAAIDELTPAHLQALCDLHTPEDVDLDFKSEDAYTTNGQEGLTSWPRMLQPWRTPAVA